MNSYFLKNLQIPVSRMPAGGDGALTAAIARELHLPLSAVQDYRIHSRSVDSRRGEPRVVYSLLVDSGIRLPLPEATPEQLELKKPALPELPETKLKNPVVVGTGPAGIFGALVLAMAGCKPVILDRGYTVDRRAEGWKKFCSCRELDPDNNLLIGEGGAGAFSDGKLHTGTRDRNRRFILEAMVEAGAPAEIAYLSRPHIGSDILPRVAVNLRKKIESLGGTFHFGVEVTGILTTPAGCGGVIDRNGQRWESPCTLIAPGLGGRELVGNLASAVQWELKPFQMGCRIEHPQTLIDRCQYHCSVRPAALGAAEYHLVSRPESAQFVSSFCMCPGGTVVNATAWRDQSISNGMSNFSRSGEFANSCLITTLEPGLFGSLEETYRKIAAIEKAVFLRGGADYALPAQDAAAFLAGKAGLRNRRSSAEPGCVSARIDDLIPAVLRDALGAALRFFDRQCPGFVRDGKLIGVESCVSAPLRFLRNEECGSSLPRLYLSGEGAGAAGGILSGAADGIRCAAAMMRSFR